MGTRRIKNRKRSYIDHPDGKRSIPMDKEMQELFAEQFAEFKKKFGREPGPNDPVFFDADADTPQYLTLDEDTLELIDEAMIFEMLKHNEPAESIYAYLKTDRIVTPQNRQFLDDDEIEEWEKAVKEYRDDPRIQQALMASLQSWIQGLLQAQREVQ